MCETSSLHVSWHVVSPAVANSVVEFNSCFLLISYAFPHACTQKFLTRTYFSDLCITSRYSHHFWGCVFILSWGAMYLRYRSLAQAKWIRLRQRCSRLGSHNRGSFWRTAYTLTKMHRTLGAFAWQCFFVWTKAFKRTCSPICDTHAHCPRNISSFLLKSS